MNTILIQLALAIAWLHWQSSVLLLLIGGLGVIALASALWLHTRASIQRSAQAIINGNMNFDLLDYTRGQP